MFDRIFTRWVILGSQWDLCFADDRRRCRTRSSDPRSYRMMGTAIPVIPMPPEAIDRDRILFDRGNRVECSDMGSTYLDPEACRRDPEVAPWHSFRVVSRLAWSVVVVAVGQVVVAAMRDDNHYDVDVDVDDDREEAEDQGGEGEVVDGKALNIGVLPEGQPEYMRRVVPWGGISPLPQYLAPSRSALSRIRS